MIVFTLSELRTIMRQAAGEVDPGTEVADVRSADLGYDSLALLEITPELVKVLNEQFGGPEVRIWGWAVEALPRDAVALDPRAAGERLEGPATCGLRVRP